MSESRTNDFKRASLKEFEPKDFGRILELDRLCFPNYLQFSFLKLNDIISDENSLTFTVKDENRFIFGYVILFLKKFEHQMLLISLAVDPEYYGKGIGSLLMDFSIKFSRHMRVDSLCLQVEEKNERGIGLFEKYGFEETEKIEDYFTENNTAMEMKLDL